MTDHEKAFWASKWLSEKNRKVVFTHTYGNPEEYTWQYNSKCLTDAELIDEAAKVLGWGDGVQELTPETHPGLCALIKEAIGGE